MTITAAHYPAANPGQYNCNCGLITVIPVDCTYIYLIVMGCSRERKGMTSDQRGTARINKINRIRELFFWAGKRELYIPYHARGWRKRNKSMHFRYKNHALRRREIVPPPELLFESERRGEEIKGGDQGIGGSCFPGN